MKSFFDLIIPARRIVYTGLSFVDRTVFKAHNPVFILSYHSVATDDWRYSVNASVVKKQISYLKKNFDIITLQTLVDSLSGKKEITRPSVVLTFDDGYKDILTLKPFFDLNHITPALFVLSDTPHANVSEMKTKRPFLSVSEIKSLKKAGWEIGCHSATHANLATLTESDLEKEIVTAKKTLEGKLGFTIPYFAYPRGKYTTNVVRLVKKAKYQLGLTMDDGIITTQSDLLTLPRIGVDRSHSFSEFIGSFSPSVVKVRGAIKNSPFGKYL